MSNSIFTGSSTYSQDFQNVINRAVAIASLPITQLQQVRAQLSDQSTALGTLNSKLASLQSALNSLAGASAAPSASASDPAVLKATAGADAMEGAYRVEITSMGSPASAMSTAGVSDPAASGLTSLSQLILTVNGTEHTINPGGESLTALAQAINAQSEGSVQATVVNVGPPDAPDYRLALEANRMAPDTISLKAGGVELLSALPGGSAVTYKVNQGAEVSSDSRTLKIAPGLTVQALGESQAGVPETVTVSPNTSAVNNSLSAFVNAYNAVVDEVGKSRGQAGGALAGQSILSTVSQALRNISGYAAATEDFNSLTSLGITFDQNGHLSVDSTTLQDAIDRDSGALENFLGRESGSGFLKAASDALDSLEADDSGAVKSALDALRSEIGRQDDQIAAYQARVDDMRTDLETRMAAADALITQLQQQVSYFTNMFEAMRVAQQGMQ